MSGPTRRAFLRGGSALIALPMLESLRPATARAGGLDSPNRMVVFFVPNGMFMPAWTPEQAGADWSPSTILEPLAPFASEVSILSGLENTGHLEQGGELHSQSTGRLLTATLIDANGGVDTANDISMDQLVAQRLAGQTAFSSLELGSEAPGTCDVQAGGEVDAYCSYLWNISWSGPGQPVARDVSPRSVFERLFSDLGRVETEIEREKRIAYKQSILDSVLVDAKRVQSRISSADRHRLDGYIEGIYEIESRLYASEVPSDACAEAATLFGVSQELKNLDTETHVRQMCDLITLALQCNKTRVISYMLGLGRSERPYAFLGIPDSHHYLSHYGNNTSYMDQITTIGRWEVEQLAYLLQRMQEVQEPDGTLLDNSMVLFVSSMGDPNGHQWRSLPVVLAGRGRGALTPGNHLVYQSQPIADLYVSMIQAMGVEQATFGSYGTGPLDGIG